jgi:hypothetical protein
LVLGTNEHDRRVTLEDNKITVANPDTGFWVSYETHPHSPYLILLTPG